MPQKGDFATADSFAGCLERESNLMNLEERHKPKKTKNNHSSSKKLSSSSFESLAEKLETIIYRGSFNSRMKDFHDLYSMITSPIFSSFHNLEAIIHLVFEH